MDFGGLGKHTQSFFLGQGREIVFDVFVLLLATLMQAISLLLIIMFQELEFFVISASLFGMSNLGIVSLTMTLAGRINSNKLSKEMAKLTFFLRLS